MPQIEIWAMPGAPLKESDWLNYGYESLADYVEQERIGHTGHQIYACKKCIDNASEPLVSFGSFDPKTGVKVVQKVCKSLDDLPTEDIEDVLIFKKQ